jgi:hypothetical protein
MKGSALKFAYTFGAYETVAFFISNETGSTGAFDDARIFAFFKLE